MYQERRDFDGLGRIKTAKVLSLTLSQDECKSSSYDKLYGVGHVYKELINWYKRVYFDGRQRQEKQTKELNNIMMLTNDMKGEEQWYVP